MTKKQIDWTKKPLGSTRPKLAKHCRAVINIIEMGHVACLLDEELRKLEKVIAAFRDNER